MKKLISPVLTCLSATGVALGIAIGVIGCSTTTATSDVGGTNIVVKTTSLDPGTVATLQSALSNGITDTATIVTLINASKGTNK